MKKLMVLGFVKLLLAAPMAAWGITVTTSIQVGGSNIALGTTTVTSGSSITASGFFGDGSHLTGVAASMVNTSSIGADSVTQAAILNGVVGTGKLSSDVQGTIAAKLSVVNTGNISQDAVASAAILNGAVGTGKLSSDVQGAIAAALSQVDTGDINADAVTSAAILNGAVDTFKLSADVQAQLGGGGPVNTGKIQADAVTTSAILNGAVTQGKTPYGYLALNLAGVPATVTNASTTFNNDVGVMGDLHVGASLSAVGSIGTSGGGDLSSNNNVYANGLVDAHFSSITASAFFGDGSHLTGLPPSGETNTYTSTKTFTNDVGILGNLNGDGNLLHVLGGVVIDFATSGLNVTGSSVTASAFFGDASHLSNVPAPGVFYTEPSFTAGLAVTGGTGGVALNINPGAGAFTAVGDSVTASAFFGDGSHLTGINPGGPLTLTTTQYYTTDVWTAPTGVTLAYISAIGGGSGAEDAVGTGGGFGGASGEYISSAPVHVIPGVSYDVIIGAGGVHNTSGTDTICLGLRARGGYTQANTVTKGGGYDFSPAYGGANPSTDGNEGSWFQYGKGGGSGGNAQGIGFCTAHGYSGAAWGGLPGGAGNANPAPPNKCAGAGGASSAYGIGGAGGAADATATPAPANSYGAGGGSSGGGGGDGASGVAGTCVIEWYQ